MLNKAVLYKEWKNFRWAALLLWIWQFFAKILPLFDIFEYIHLMEIDKIPYEPEEIPRTFYSILLYDGKSDVLVMILIMIIFSIILFYDLRNLNYSVIHSMPFKRKELIFNKLFIGFAIITGIFFINFIIITCIFFAVKSYCIDYLNYTNIIRWTIINMLTHFSAFSLAMVVQSFTGSIIAGGIITPIIFALPFGLSAMIEEFVESISGLYCNLYDIGEKMTFIVYNVTFNEYYEYFTLKCLILIILTIAFSLITIHSYKKNNLENNGNLFVFKPLEIVFTAGFTLCFSLLIIDMFFRYQSPVVIMSFTLIFAIIGYFIAKTIIRLTSTIKRAITP